MSLDGRWMSRAVCMAGRGLGTTAPNPSVGAVLIKDNQLVGEGHTQPVGGPHAEVMAIADCRERGFDPAGSTLYVTLEPCNHHGRTPPCTDAILEARIERVVVGCLDPFPKMQGKSLCHLREAGVEVVLGVLEEECKALVRGFARALVHALPEVTCKVAMSLDGHIATASGESQWITGPESREHGHGLRHSHDAILVGRRTVEADDPRLTCRLPGGVHPTPVVLDTGLTLAADAKVLHGPARAVIVCAADAPERELNADVVRVPRGNGGVDIEQALRALATRGLHRVLIEGGGEVHRSLLDAGLVDTLRIYVAGVVVPGGRSWIGGPPLAALGDALRLDAPEVTALGPDVLLTYTLPHRLGA
ncbi:MAG: bifunctional diaminohydroxyphosphoribosylaminopyrimidine deaminase/5-amino-6-(5-phosphoribosylamino)uracil reductase RibD [Deltaproteobacteria bacterium]|nr:MAG: bifunctional diaminohydroxyphosphoribosylaminopyrimidine deaminase/5-amino-6-(5-phosphoribosylamino)uracil reductase RibD [Deltaproteobacteria bacterium]